MRKPIIGIIPTINIDKDDPYLDQARFVNMYADKIIESGGIPIGMLSKNIDYYLEICDGYLWPGGSKIEWAFQKIFFDAMKNNKPVLGICLGMQTITTFFNILKDKEKSQYEDLHQIYDETKEDNPYLKRLEEENIHFNIVTKDQQTVEDAKHEIKIEKDSILYDIYKTEKMDVVSLHSFVVARTPNNINISGKSNDNIVEAIEYKKDGNLFLGIQWHPEIIENENRIFEWLVNSCFKYQVLVNRENEIKYRENYQIVSYDSKYPQCINDSNLEEKTYDAWLKYKEYLNKNGYDAEIESAYRTKKIQEEIYQDIERKKGNEYAKKYVAKPGFSEHELGLAIDLCLEKNGIWFHEFQEECLDFYAEIASSCADFGFILRYPKRKENITKYNYEPWHIRYVGSRTIAHYIMSNNLTLEEYLDLKN